MYLSRAAVKVFYKNANKELLDAARSPTVDSVDRAQRALKNGADLNVKDIRLEGELNSIGIAYTPLMWAAFNGDLELVRFFISKGANVELRTLAGNTALHIAAREGHIHIVEFLGHHYPKLLNELGENDLTPKEMAEKYGKSRSIVEFFNKNFVSSYLGNFINAFATELALNVNFAILNDPISLINLSRANRAWHNVFLTPEVQLFFDKSLRSCLPPDIQDKTWEQVFHYFYPNEKTNNPLHALFHRAHYYYFLGNPIEVLIEKSIGTQFLKLAAAVITHQRSSSRAYRHVSDEELKDNLKTYLAAKDTQDKSTLTIYRTLKDASNAESNSVKQSHYKRTPIFTLKFPTETALELMKIKKDIMDYPAANGFFKVQDVRMVSSLRSDLKDEAPKTLDCTHVPICEKRR